MRIRKLAAWRLREPRARLVAASFLLLFLELALIRWTGSNIVYLSFFSNFVLLGSFLGIGIGFLRAGARADLFRWAPLALAALVAFVLLIPVEVDRSGRELVFFGELTASGLPRWIVLPAIFLSVAAVMAMVAQGVARAFARFPPLDAYRLDLVGSLVGIAGFSALSFLEAPPVAWAAVTAATLALLRDESWRRLQALGLLALVGLLLFESLGSETTWSPYYKLELVEERVLGSDVLRIDANGVPHQQIDTVNRRRFFGEIYFEPYRLLSRTSPGDVLIVGAGTGSDVAVALAQGARHVDAVEIDPRIVEIGRTRHPDRPYADQRVDVHIDDARAFLERTDRTWDLILFALPDSLTLVAGQSSLRLESYLLTKEALESARDHLRSGGAFGMYNFFREDWLVDRLGASVEQVYGSAPCLESVGGEARMSLLMAGADPAAVDCAATWKQRSVAAPRPATDDHPFPYLRDRTLPGLHLLTIVLILLSSIVLVRGAGGPIRPMARYVDLFFMGLAFLLLETKNVVQFALLFGTTWFVNALVFAGILLAVLAAVEVARRWDLRRPQWLYAALVAALAVAFAVPQRALLDLPTVSRFAAATTLAFFPVFLANLVFARRFREVETSTTAFAANLLGAMVGGTVEYLALLTGYRALLLVVAAAYGLVFVTGRPVFATPSRARRAASAEPATVS